MSVPEDLVGADDHGGLCVPEDLVGADDHGGLYLRTWLVQMIMGVCASSVLSFTWSTE